LGHCEAKLNFRAPISPLSEICSRVSEDCNFLLQPFEPTTPLTGMLLVRFTVTYDIMFGALTRQRHIAFRWYQHRWPWTTL